MPKGQFQNLNSMLFRPLALLAISMITPGMITPGAVAQSLQPTQTSDIKPPAVANPADSPPQPRSGSQQSGSQQSGSLVQPKEDAQKKPKRKKLEFTKRGGVVYQTIDGEELKCDIYTPQGKGPFPAILAVHGGAWRQGSKFALLRHAWKMAQSGYVVVAINYRHAPKHPFPAQIHDCKHAIRWMKSNSEKYKIDANRVGAFGYSAGGHLVSLLGTSDQDDGLEGPIKEGLQKFDARVKVVAAGGAPCEFSWIKDDSRVLGYWLGGSPKQKPEAYRAASPTTYVSVDDPPFFFFHGTSDLIVPVSSSESLHDLLKQKGVQSQHFSAKGSGHIATFSDLQWMEKAIDFFDEHLKNEDDNSKQPKTSPHN